MADKWLCPKCKTENLASTSACKQCGRENSTATTAATPSSREGEKFVAYFDAYVEEGKKI